MAEVNGLSSGDPRVDAALKRLQEKNDARFKDLEDAMLVHAHLEAAAGRRIKEHAEILVSHHALLVSHGEMARLHDDWMKHFQEKLDALTDIVMRREGGPEAQ